MKKILLPAILLVVGLGGGFGAGIILSPSENEPEDTGQETGVAESDSAGEALEEGPEAEDTKDAEPSEADKRAVEFLNMTNQFIIPLVDDGDVNGLVVLSVSLEVVEGTIAQVHQLEPKIRDRFLQVLFNHANNGGFAGNFTDFRYMKSLKDELRRNAQVVAGKSISDVLILDLVRQDPS